ncbi:C-type lectin domain family 4 member G isoform X2 [Rhinopithecus roxellana]|uniref:C-type lectin domain family 4 member G n=1 Tax=Rhinopithecus roxellana TaxID=61622 RepID=A0A2K6RCK1_RHIRO|nr:C-type lectin domain family 4 member G isoform X2 [Rhinopithecus roxellana]
MDTTRYSKWGGSSEEVPGGHWGHRVHWSRRPLFLALAVLVTIVLWAVILSILLSKASTERAALLGGQDLLRTNGSGTQAQLQTTRAELGEAQAKLMEQESALRELRERVTQGLAEASRNREDVRTELFRALEAVRLHNNSCEPCPTSWLSFEGSCYFFSVPKTTWAAAQGHCANASAHLVIVGGLEEQGFLTRNTRGRGYWLGLRAVRHLGKIQGYQWVDGVSLSFSHWNRGEPNDARGREDCVMMLRTGLWNDAPCDSEKDGWICEKRHNC